MTLNHFRRGVLPGVCTLLLAACGGGGDESAPQAAAPADSTAPAVAPVTAPAPIPTPGPAAGDSAAPATAPRPSSSQSLAEQALEAPVTGPVNAQVLDGYQLSMDRIRQLGRAGQSLGELQRRRPELRDSMRLEAFDPNLMYERMNAIPDARAAIASVGMTPREYVTATAALIQAAAVAGMKRRGMEPKGEYNERNVQFVTEHWDEIQSLMRSMAPQQPRPQS